MGKRRRNYILAALFAVLMVCVLCFCTAQTGDNNNEVGEEEPAPATSTIPRNTSEVEPPSTQEPVATTAPVTPSPTSRPTERPTARATAPLLPTPSPGPICDCSGDTLNCTDFNRRSSAQACHDYCLAQGAGDIHGLDADGNGQVCESMP